MTNMTMMNMNRKNKAHDLSGYVFCKGEIVLIDTNVWLYLNPPPTNSKHPPSSKHRAASIYGRVYGRGLKAMLSKKARLVMDALVLGEYLNAYCRIEWRASYQAKYPKFKDFRKSSDFSVVGNGAAIFARSMLQLCTRCDYPFSMINVAQTLSDFEIGSNDINDGFLAETCRHNNWKLVTHDSDFTSGGIEILTGNRKLLKACR